MRLAHFIFLFVAGILVLPQPTFAQQPTAGVTPDSFLYSLDVALDKINLLLTFDNKAKAQRGLLIARERLMEVREMTLENKLDAAQRAENEHRNFIASVESAVRNIERTNSTEEIEDEIEIERELEEYEKEFETVRNELKVKVEIKGEITSQQRELVDSILNSMRNKTGEVKIEIENKKGETKIKIKQLTGKSEEEIEEEIKTIEESKNVTSIRMEKALDKIEDASEEMAELKEKLSSVNATEVNITAINALLAQAESHLSKAQSAFNETKYGEAFGQAVSAERLVENAERMFERQAEIGEEREIEVEIEKGVAEVEVEIAGMKMKYRLNMSDKSEIVADIARRTGLKTPEIERKMKIEIEEEEKE